jgi:cytosine/adenosine deaminase-related metal-dependent hydrolase
MIGQQPGNSSLLWVRNIHTLVTMDAQRREIRNGALLVRDGVIIAVGTTAELEAIVTADPSLTDVEIVDLGDRHLVMPGLVNTHHHFYQSLTRAIPGAQEGTLFDWLTTLYPIWSQFTPDAIALSSQIAAAELILSGCTTSSDHLYLFPNGCRLDDEIAAIAETGLRFHACRGSMSVGQSQGGLPPDALVETEADILKDSQRVIEQYHDPSRYAMVRIALAPCSPFSVSPDLMRESAALARNYPGVRLHTHLAENQADIDYSREKFDMTPGEYAESVGWLGADTWHAHCVKLDHTAIDRFAATGTGVAHCPCSNMRLGSGSAPIRLMRDRGVAVGLGVDGSASNDAGNLLQEARQALLLARVREGDAGAMTARQALELATQGGAKVLGRDDIGALSPGMAADFIAINLDRLSLAGALHDPVAAMVFCQIDRVDYSYINGRLIVKQGQLCTMDTNRLIVDAHRFTEELVN